MNTKTIKVIYFDKHGDETHVMKLGLSKPIELNNETPNKKRATKKKVLDILERSTLLNSKGTHCITVGTKESFSFILKR